MAKQRQCVRRARVSKNCGSLATRGFSLPVLGLLAANAYASTTVYGLDAEPSTRVYSSADAACNSFMGRANDSDAAYWASWNQTHPTNQYAFVAGAITSAVTGSHFVCTRQYTLNGNPATGYANGYLLSVGSAITVPRANNPPSSSCSGRADPGQGNPIYPLRSVKRETVDLGIRVGGVPLSLTYDSSALVPKLPADPAGGTVNYGELGRHWSSTLFKRIATSSTSTGGVIPAAATASRGDGTAVTFARNVSTGQYTPEANHADALVALSGGALRYYNKSANAQETYDPSGRLTNINWANGESIALSYSTASTPVSVAPGAGYLIQAIDQSGRLVSFAYTARVAPLTGAQLVTITDPAGYQLTLDSNAGTGDLGAIHWSDGKVKTFLYEANSVGALTGITDELNQRYATFGYDASWRAISTEHAGGVDRVTTTYSKPPSILVNEVYDSTANAVFRYYDWGLPQVTVVTGPLGTQSTWGAQSLLNKNYLTSQSQPAGSGCAASSSTLSYDANGNIASSNDFNGGRVCYTSDLSRNLETSRVEGLSSAQTCSAVTGAGATLPTGSRKVSTAWHPDWRLEAKRAEPGKLTTSIYNGQPDPFNSNAIASCAPGTALLPDGKPVAVLCKQVEQATTDANGSQGFSASLQSGVANRVRQWAYNQYGKVLTETDPLNNTTTYTYYAGTTADHTLGDLQSVTNAKNQVTSYTKYNKHGQLLESTDPNGVTTVNTFDLRQRLLSTGVGGQTTSHEYDAVGQLLKVTQPDASWIGYEYDAAHRQTAVKDNLGNRIEYVLDNAGNKTGQSVKDPGGNLARSLARSIDALGRIQQTTGRE